jgi:histidinol dehydrogenase
LAPFQYHEQGLQSLVHDEDAQSILLCPDADFIAQVEASIAKLLPTMTRKTIEKRRQHARLTYQQ